LPLFLNPKTDISVLKKAQSGFLFNGINKKYGSADAYIQQVLKINENKWDEYIRKFMY
jgi:protein-tyrosine phosphatase